MTKPTLTTCADAPVADIRDVRTTVPLRPSAARTMERSIVSAASASGSTKG